MLKMFSTGQILTQTNLLLRKSYVSYPEPDKPRRGFKFGRLYLWSSLISYYQSCSHFELKVPAVNADIHYLDISWKYFNYNIPNQLWWIFAKSSSIWITAHWTWTQRPYFQLKAVLNYCCCSLWTVQLDVNVPVFSWWHGQSIHNNEKSITGNIL